MIRQVVKLAVLAVLMPAVARAQGGTRSNRNTPAPQPSRWALAPDSSNVARFIVREQLAGAELPNDAVGITKAITGGLLFDASGKMDSANSKITVDMRTLTTDRSNRDRFIKRNTIVTDSFPNAVMTISGIQGLPAKLPAAGPLVGTVTGTLTLHGVTKPVTWELNGTINGNDISGKVSTHIHFGDYNMTQPRVMIVVSVVDDVKLEYDFHFVKTDNK